VSDSSSSPTKGRGFLVTKSMKLLFLRGQVPIDRDPSQIVFDNINECDDVWTQLAYHLSDGEQSEIWYWGGRRKHYLATNFLERWVPNFSMYRNTFKPDVIIARGGFKAYVPVLSRFSRTFKVYYGAGKRFCPTDGIKYNLIIVDTSQQLRYVQKKYPNILSSMFIKPAADNIFFKCSGKKKFDAIFVGNYSPRRDIKNHKFILDNFPSDLRLLQSGISLGLNRQYRRVKFMGWQPRKKLPGLYAQAKVALVCCKNIDSCPRVIPEALACNCPLLVLDSVRFWKEKYITPYTGVISPSDRYWNELRVMIRKQWNPRAYYLKNLSLQPAARYLSNLIQPKMK